MNYEVLDLGLMEYEQAWKLQDEYASGNCGRESALRLAAA